MGHMTHVSFKDNPDLSFYVGSNYRIDVMVKSGCCLRVFNLGYADLRILRELIDMAMEAKC